MEMFTQFYKHMKTYRITNGWIFFGMKNTLCKINTKQNWKFTFSRTYATFPRLNSHVWLVSTTKDSTDLQIYSTFPSLWNVLLNRTASVY